MDGVGRTRKPASERRKQQNRQAQKNYRERQNRRLRTLEALIESREVPFTSHRVASANILDPSQGFAAHTPESLATSEEFLQCRQADPAAGKSQIQALLSSDSRSCRSGSSSRSESSWPLATRDGLERLLDDDDRRIISSKGLNIHDVLKAGIQAMTDYSKARRHPLATSDMPIPHEPDDQEPGIRTDRIYLLENAFREHAHYLPDMHANSIRINQFCVVAAIRRNAEMLGVSFEQVIDLEMNSSFYDPSYTAHEESVAGAPKFEHLTSDLRPTPAQFKYQHSAWIDTMPFPTLRQRLIESINADPPIVDEDEFCQDLEYDALVCWGSTGAKTERATGSGAPWDVRSWEAQPWFLRKWWFLLGGPNGELFQSSRWWNEMRGDFLTYAWR